MQRADVGQCGYVSRDVHLPISLVYSHSHTLIQSLLPYPNNWWQVTSDLSLRNYLREFTDHQLVERKAASAGGGAGGSSSSSSSSSSVKYVYVINLVEDVIRKVILAEKSESGG